MFARCGEGVGDLGAVAIGPVRKRPIPHGDVGVVTDQAIGISAHSAIEHVRFIHLAVLSPEVNLAGPECRGCADLEGGKRQLVQHHNVQHSGSLASIVVRDRQRHGFVSCRVPRQNRVGHRAAHGGEVIAASRYTGAEAHTVGEQPVVSDQFTVRVFKHIRHDE